MSVLLGFGDRLIPGTALYLAFSSALFFGAIALLVSRPSYFVLTGALTVGACLTPLVFIYQGIIWKDVLFANLTILAFCILTIADLPKKSQRYAFYGVVILLTAFAAMVRQNGFIAILCTGMVVGCYELKWMQRNIQNKRVVYFLSVLLCYFAVAFGLVFSTNGIIRASALRQTSAIGDGIVVLLRYDIVGISARAKDADFQFMTDKGVDIKAFRKAAVEFYTPSRVDNPNNPEDQSVIADGFSHLSAADTFHLWWRLVLTQPKAYLTHRMKHFVWLMFPQKPYMCLPIHVGVDGPRDLMLELKLQPGQRPSDQALYRYSQHYIGGPLMNATFYAVAAVLLLFMLLLRPAEGSISMVFMLIAALAFGGSYFVIGIACDFRYVYFMAVAPIAALLYVVAHASPDWQRRIISLPRR
jgi:hypothetical protein